MAVQPFNLKHRLLLLAAVGSAVLATPVHAEFSLDAVELGLRYELNLRPGQPTNDINGYSFIA